MTIPRRNALLIGLGSSLGLLTSLRDSNICAGQETKPEETTPLTSKHGLPVRMGLNSSTIRGQKLSLPEQIELAADVGYDAIEPWLRDIVDFEKSGGSLESIRKLASDAKIEISSAIGFAQWIVDNPEERSKGLNQAAEDMRRVREIGGRHIAAPPIGAHRPNQPQPSLKVMAERYRALCEVGRREGVSPQLELWGFSPTLSKLEELAYVATAAAHPNACVLPDFYHIYKGGNSFDGLSMIEASSMPNFHINDYPEMSIESIGDKDRVFPGDGACPLPKLISGLLQRGFNGCFSLELFNRDYWNRDAKDVAKEGLEKGLAVVNAAIAMG